MYNPNHHINPHYRVVSSALHLYMLSLQPKCRYITTERSRHFQPVKMSSELNSSTSTDIDEGQAEIQLPPVWKMQKIFTSSGAPRANKGNRKNLTVIYCSIATHPPCC